MRRQSKILSRGFTLMEMTVAMALGLVVLGAAVQMYSKGVKGTFAVTQRAELQQDFRAAANMLTRDISMAGSGLGNNVQIGLPSGNGVQKPVYGCDQTNKCYINGGAVAYPSQGGVPYLYGLMPGYQFGPTINAAAGPTDTITVVNTDTNFLLNCYWANVTGNATVWFALENTPANRPADCVVPPPLLNPQDAMDPAVGLTPGDLIWFNVSIGAGVNAQTAMVIAEVTNIRDLGTMKNVANPLITNAHVWAVDFAAGDPLRMNQPAATSGSLQQAIAGRGIGTRLNVISYYIDNTLTPPRMMRQVSGHTPIPVAENVSFLQFSYDLYNFTTGQMWVRQFDGGASQGWTPNLITKINVEHMSMASTQYGTEGYQGLDLTTSVSARDLTFKNDYPIK